MKKYTYKKRISAYQEKWSKEKIKNVNKKEKLVYLYESGVNNRSKDGYGYSKKENCCILMKKKQVNE